MSTGLIRGFELDHVGIAASTSSLPLLDLLETDLGKGQQMPSGVTVEKFGPGEKIELVWPATEGSPVQSFLERRGPGLHHIGLRVEGPLEALLPQLTEAGVRLAGKIEPSADGRPSLFIHPESTGGVLVELIEGAIDES
jgi:methylmalonyl-CoA epimerase